MIVKAAWSTSASHSCSPLPNARPTSLTHRWPSVISEISTIPPQMPESGIVIPGPGMLFVDDNRCALNNGRLRDLRQT